MHSLRHWRNNPLWTVRGEREDIRSTIMTTPLWPTQNWVESHIYVHRKARAKEHDSKCPSNESWHARKERGAKDMLWASTLWSRELDQKTRECLFFFSVFLFACCALIQLYRVEEINITRRSDSYQDNQAVVAARVKIESALCQAKNQGGVQRFRWHVRRAVDPFRCPYPLHRKLTQGKRK